jgi:hypothetical protein
MVEISGGVGRPEELTRGAGAYGEVDPAAQAVLFYLYFDDIAATHARMKREGFEVGEMAFPFYCPKGEFRIIDPDGYVLMLTHT